MNVLISCCFVFLLTDTAVFDVDELCVLGGHNNLCDMFRRWTWYVKVYIYTVWKRVIPTGVYNNRSYIQFKQTSGCLLET